MTTRRSTAAIATVRTRIEISEPALSQARSSVRAATIARPIASSERPIAARTTTRRACELLSATTEVALVETISTTPDQPTLESSEAST